MTKAGLRFIRKLVKRRREQIALLCDAERRAAAKELPKLTVEQAYRYMETAQEYGLWA